MICCDELRLGDLREREAKVGGCVSKQGQGDMRESAL